MSYDGQLDFGLLGDYDAMPDLDALAAVWRPRSPSSRAAAGVAQTDVEAARRPARRRKPATTG